MATRKNVAAVTIPSNQNFAIIATAIFNGDSNVRAVVTETENMLAKARATSLTNVAAALNGFPQITEEMWKLTYGPGLSSALKKLYGNDNSAKSTLTRWKRAILAITSGKAPLAGETLNAFNDRVYGKAKKTGKGRGGVDKLEAPKGETRVPQLPVAPSSDNADTAEKMMHDACLFIASISDTHEAALAAALDAVFSDEKGALAFLAWFNAREAAARKEAESAATSKGAGRPMRRAA